MKEAPRRGLFHFLETRSQKEPDPRRSGSFVRDARFLAGSARGSSVTARSYRPGTTRQPRQGYRSATEEAEAWLNLPLLFCLLIQPGTPESGFASKRCECPEPDCRSAPPSPARRLARDDRHRGNG
jgi:hypothetical protein